MKPVEPTIQQRPYLGPECYIANVTDADRRLKVESTFKHLLSKRPRHLLKPEIYHWEKIYKVTNNKISFRIFIFLLNAFVAL